MRNRVAVEVAIGHLHLGVEPALLRHDGGTELAADGSGAERAGIEVEQLHDGDLGKRQRRRGVQSRSLLFWDKVA